MSQVPRRSKIYDTHALIAEDVAESEQVLVAEESFEEDFVDQLAAEGDEDAILVCEYESAMQDTIQEDEELAQAYNAYTDARKRLSDRFKNRGSWPSSGSSKEKSKGFKGYQSSTALSCTAVGMTPAVRNPQETTLPSAKMAANADSEA